TCDGVTRRDVLKVGMLGLSGLTLSGYLRMAHAGQVQNSRARAAIFINLPGGPSHMDTFDLKPDAPAEYRGLFNPIPTNVEGIQISEHLPKLARCTDKFAILRGVTHTLGAHQLGSEYVNTGTRPLPSLEYPGYGAVFSKENEANAPRDLPPFVAIPNSRQRPGYLGVKYAPLNTGSMPRPGQPFSVRGIQLAGGLTISEIEKRQSLRRDLDTAFQSLENSNQLLEGLDQFSQQAYSMITSPRARDAFDVSKESPEFAAQFGETPFGVSCLLATRLVEAGVGFVTISLGGWDTHANNFPKLKDNLCPTLDEGLAGLLCGLEQKGLLGSTAVYVTGEFGRTPKINERSDPGGRDHYPRCMFMLLAGGSVRGGQVIGESDETASGPAGEGRSPDD
ncbi:MAG: DUF1501 domain-containing protein, partial [Planctomycetaceae bacterium]